jgi:hypothetical protein
MVHRYEAVRRQTVESSPQCGRLMFSITPPRKSTSPEDAQQIAKVTIERLRPLGLDALIVYDIDEESDRNPDDRPFPATSTPST